MGDRGNIIIESERYGTTYLYCHWFGSELREVLAEALERGRSRWDDPPYLTAIIFRQMVKAQGGDLDELTGLGISQKPTDGGTDIVVDMDQGRVDGIPFPNFIIKNQEV